MKKLLFFLLTSIINFNSFATGEIAFTSFQTDDPDSFTFVTLVDFPGNYELHFTDNGWLAAGGFRSGEGVLTWTTPSVGVPAGTQITIFGTGSAEPNNITGPGTLTVRTDDGGSFNLAATGDQIIAYFLQNGTNNITPIAAINFATSNWSADATSSNNSALPTGLTEGTNAISLSNIDNGKFDCTGGTTTGTASGIGTSVNTEANWTTSDTQLTPTTSPCVFSISGAALPVKLISLNARTREESVELTWQTAEELNFSHFEILKGQNPLSLENKAAVNSKGNIDGSYYTFEDLKPALGQNYYQLKMVDYDGTAQFSKLIAIEYLPDNVIEIYPNPVSDAENLHIVKGSNIHLREIFDQYGKCIGTDTQNLTKGLYVLHFTDINGRNFTKKLIKN